MTTRDPRSPPDGPDSGTGDGPRDPTQQLSIDSSDDEGPSHPSLALGTHGTLSGRDKYESAGAKPKTPAPRISPKPSSSRDTEDADRVGQVLGSYRVVELLGKGGMGYVYRAEHTKLGREVAIKLLRSDYARRRDAVARFIQEARTVNRIRHRNIVDVPDIVELDDGTTFIVMEFLRGQSLGAWSRTGIDLPRALAVLVQICDGLGAAHEVGIVHRDLKPDNVIVIPTSDGAELVKLLDFGVAKLLNRDDEDIGFQTQAGSVIGTPAYMSPEQAGGMVVDARSDTYSLGAIMYELFCGQPMFRGKSFGEYVRKHLTEPPVRPRDTPLGTQIDPRLEVLILKCLEKDPNQRYGHILELRDALLYMLGGLDSTLTPSAPARPVTLPSGALPPVAVTPTAPTPSSPSAPRGQLYPGDARPSSVPMPRSGGQDARGSGPPAAYSGEHRGSGEYRGSGPGYASGIVAPPSGQALLPGQPTGMTGEQYALHPSQLPPVPTPWWVWVSGGAIAVAIGIGGAVWYAGRADEPAPDPVARSQPAPPAQPVISASQPTAVPPAVAAVVPPAPPPSPQLEVRFDSLPRAAVYAEGRSAQLCTTPCTFKIDPNDGGATDRRTFVVRAEKYKDALVIVDLKGSQRDFRVTLDRPETIIIEKRAPAGDPKTNRSKPAERDRGKERTKERVKEKVRPSETELEDDDTLMNPSQLDRKPKAGRIDPATTRDPFRK